MQNIDWLSPTQIKSLVDGGSMFFEIIEEDMEELPNKEFDEIIDSKLQIGDEFYVQEDVFRGASCGEVKSLGIKPCDILIKDIDKQFMQPYQSRVKGKIKNVELVRVQDLFNNLDTEKEYYDLLEKFNVKTFGGGQIADTGDYGDYWFTIGEPIESDDGMHILNSWENEETLDMFIIDYYSKNGTYEDNPYIILYEIENIKNKKD